MSPTEDRKSKAAAEMESYMEAREDARREAESQTTKGLNQGMETTGHDAKHPGINWGPSYKARRKSKSQQAPKNRK